MGKPVAVFTDPEEVEPEPGVRLLVEAGFEVRIAESRDPDVIAALAADAVALVVGYARIDGPLLDRLPSLRILATMSAGHDMVDTAAAAERGLWVTHLPSSATEDVAAHALASALALVRGLPQAAAAVRAGGWSTDFLELPRRTSELTLGLVGMGRIARTLARYAAPLFGRVAAYDPRAPTDRWPEDVERFGLHDLLDATDVLSLHCPLTEETRGLADAALLARLRPGSWLVNVSRGELVDAPALLRALDTGHLTGAALDVFPVEPPPPDDPLRTHPRLLLSPHSAYRSDASLRAYAAEPAENILAWHRTGTPLTPVVTPVMPNRAEGDHP